MESLIQKMKALSSAEDFFKFFSVPYEDSVVHVNRLHILKRFYQYLHRSPDLAGLGDIDLYRRYREMLAQAYTDFTTSNAQQEKVFKVFQDAAGTQHVPLASLRDRLPQRRAA